MFIAPGWIWRQQVSDIACFCAARRLARASKQKRRACLRVLAILADAHAVGRIRSQATEHAPRGFTLLRQTEAALIGVLEVLRQLPKLQTRGSKSHTDSSGAEEKTLGAHFGHPSKDWPASQWPRRRSLRVN